MTAQELASAEANRTAFDASHVPNATVVMVGRNLAKQDLQPDPAPPKAEAARPVPTVVPRLQREPSTFRTEMEIPSGVP